MKFDDSYLLLEDLYADKSVPKKQTDQVKAQLGQIIARLEQGCREPSKLQPAFDKLTDTVNGLGWEEAAEAVAADVLYILEWFDVDLDVEDALRRRHW